MYAVLVMGGIHLVAIMGSIVSGTSSMLGMPSMSSSRAQSRIPAVQALELQGNGIGDEGIVQLAELLAHRPVCTEICL